MQEYSAVTSRRFSHKAIRILRERLLKASKHGSPISARRCNKNHVYCISLRINETKRLAGVSSGEMKQLSCLGNLGEEEGGRVGVLQSFVTVTSSYGVERK